MLEYLEVETSAYACDDFRSNPAGKRFIFQEFGLSTSHKSRA